MSSDETQSWEVSPANLGWVEDLYLAYKENPARVDEAWRQAFARVDRGEPLFPAGAPGRAIGRFMTAPVAPRDADAVAPQTPSQDNGRGHGNGKPTNGGHDGEPRPRPRALRAETPVPAAMTVTARDAGVAAAAAERAMSGKRIRRLIEDYREIGHMAADLDPLGLVNRRANRLRVEDYGLDDGDLDRLVNVVEDGTLSASPLRDVLDRLDQTYCRHIGVELAHIHDNNLRAWLQDRVESTGNRISLTRTERLHLLAKVTEAEVFEQFLQTKFLGAKRFSLEGAESLIPMLDRIIDRSAMQGVAQVVIGMAHRGRLNVLANVLGKPSSEIFAEFLDKANTLQWDPGGDVKYHLGYSNDRVTSRGRVHMSLCFNPSHLEWVNPVVMGRTRAKQDRIRDMARSRGLPIIIHGDAAFAGQGIVYETLQMSGLAGYTVGGTIHVIINNQIGFTASPRDTYSTTYCTDVARMLQVPILHVNAEDPEAVAQVVDIAVDFRQRFQRDVFIDMWCYRKLGHNEGDEPGFTQPLMYQRIANKRPAREEYVEAFARSPSSEAPITQEDVDRVVAEKHKELDDALESAKSFHQPPFPSTFAGVWSRMRGGRESAVRDVATAVSREAIETVGRALTILPPGFHPHPNLAKRLLRNRQDMAAGRKPIDWGMAEALAFGTLLGEGLRVRMSGQDVRRGTFSHRHATYVDYETGAEYTPLADLAEGQGTFEIYDSLLSESGVLGFEYGYSLDTPDGLVIWEAQFGDFVNGAQVIIDQFLVSSEAKWRRVSGLVLLLPHGMEGQGPEHSSGKVERFLNMCVNDNIQVCDVTTPAQFFHLLRRQVLRSYRKPLIVMSPKSLLRHPMAVSSLDEFTSGSFRHILPDPEADPAKVDRILLCSGKVYYDLVAARSEHKLHNVAIVRVEQLYPLRMDELLETLSVYHAGIRCLWVQEEARNMGPWHYVHRNLRPLLLSFFRWGGISRPQSSSPATGSAARHKLEHARLIEAALGLRPENQAAVPRPGPTREGEAA
jgi:2-oxoglutarate dehydrogenase E1 component